MASRESIAALAYQLWIARGRPHGSHDQDWLEAERQLGGPSDAKPSKSQSPSTGAGRKPRGSTASAPKGAGAARSAVKSTGSRSARNPPVDETDDAQRSAPKDIGGR